MLSKLFDLLQTPGANQDDVQLSEADTRLACAALLIEVAIIDNEFDGAEMAALRDILQNQFNVESKDIDDIITLAHSQCNQSTSMYQFTHLVNLNCSAEQKYDLVANLWRIAYADGDLDKYEEYIVRKISDLIYLSHGEFIRAKHTARSEFDG